MVVTLQEYHPTASATDQSYLCNNAVTNYNSLASLNAPASTVLVFEVDNVNADPTAPDDLNSVSGWGRDADGGSGSFQAFNYATGCTGIAPQPCSGVSAQTGRHSDGSNFLMNDGHVKWLRPGAVSSGYAAISATSASTLNNNFAPVAGTEYSGNPSCAATFSPL